MSARLTLLSLVAEAAVRSGRRRMARKAALLGLAALCATFAMAAGLVAAGLWLATKVSPVAAALILTGSLAGLAMVFAMLANGSARHDIFDRVVDEAGRIHGAVEAEMREKPIGPPLAIAGLAGLVIGLRLFGRR